MNNDPVMGSEQIARLRRSFQLLIPVSDIASDRFYGKLFEDTPSVRSLFSIDPIMQGEKFMMMLAVLMDNLDNSDRLRRECHALGARHAGYGARHEHYPLVCEALLFGLRSTLGSDLSPEDEDAWRELLTRVARFMEESAERIEASP